MKDPYTVIKSRHITEKSAMLEQMQGAEGNRSIARFKSPKVVFLVDVAAGKQEIAEAVEAIYKERNIKVIKVNTISIPGKMKRRGKGRLGKSAAIKKAIVTLEPGDQIDNT